MWLPWFIKRYIFFQKNIPKPPRILETEERVNSVTGEKPKIDT